jgi:hypothetical protein
MDCFVYQFSKAVGKTYFHATLGGRLERLKPVHRLPIHLAMGRAFNARP